MAIALTISADLELFFQYLEEEKKKTHKIKHKKTHPATRKQNPNSLFTYIKKCSLWYYCSALCHIHIFMCFVSGFLRYAAWGYWVSNTVEVNSNIFCLSAPTSSSSFCLLCPSPFSCCRTISLPACIALLGSPALFLQPFLLLQYLPTHYWSINLLLILSLHSEFSYSSQLFDLLCPKATGGEQKNTLILASILLTCLLSHHVPQTFSAHTRSFCSSQGEENSVRESARNSPWEIESGMSPLS